MCKVHPDLSVVRSGNVIGHCVSVNFIGKSSQRIIIEPMSPQYYKDEFLFFKPIFNPEVTLNEDRLIVESSRISETVDYIISNNITSLHISSEYYKNESIDFVKQVNFIKGLFILQEKMDLSAVNELTVLEELRINTSISLVDFSNLPKLKTLSLDFDKNATNIHLCKQLECLSIIGFKEKNLKTLDSLKSLRSLNLYNTFIEDLTGIENLKELTVVRINTARRLISLNGIFKGLQNLGLLDIYGAPLLNDYSSLKGMRSIKQLELRKTGDVESTTIFESLPNLEHLTLGLKVLDGKMTRLKNIPSVGYIDYPHYDVKLKKLKG